MATIKEFFGSEAWRRLRKLTLPEDCVVCGVCAALGKASPFAPWMWRVLFCATTFAWGVGAIAYLVLWISIPGEKHEEA